MRKTEPEREAGEMEVVVFAGRPAWRQCSERLHLNRHPSGKRCELFSV